MSASFLDKWVSGVLGEAPYSVGDKVRIPDSLIYEMGKASYENMCDQITGQIVASGFCFDLHRDVNRMEHVIEVLHDH